MSIFSKLFRNSEQDEPKYKVGDIVMPTELCVRNFDNGTNKYQVVLTEDDVALFYIYTVEEFPKFRIVDMDENFDAYIIEEVLPSFTGEIHRKSVSFKILDNSTIHVSEDVLHNIKEEERLAKEKNIKEQSDIRKYKRAVKVCDENLAEIVNIPIVNAIIPLHAVFCEDDNAGFMTCALWQEKREDSKSGFATNWAVRCPLYELYIANGYFVQDACDGWRWLSDEDWEKHKDDLITE